MITNAQTWPGGVPDAQVTALLNDHGARVRLHCYRMLGSLEDAEDLCQETMLRAWARLDSLREPAAVRGWLLRIATNLCLDHLARRRRRFLPQDLGPAEGTGPPAQPPAMEVPWLEPLPASWLELVPDPADPPEAQAETNESVRLAFIAALQHLPPRQRAALILADVLGWAGRDIADAIETTVPAVNSALQRARVTLRRRYPAGMPDMSAEASAVDGVVDAYVRCWEAGDLDGLARLLTEDAVLAMPPTLDWYAGRGAVIDFLRWAWSGDAGLGPFRLRRISANGGPAIGLYGGAGSTDRFDPLAVKVLDLRGGCVSAITGFVLPGLFPRFALPEWV